MERLLIVEDDVAFARILETFFTRNGFATDFATSVKAAGNMIRKQEYNLFLLDYRLPDGTGLDILQTIRHNDKQVPALIMTGFNDIRTVVRAMKMGAADYIIKPVNPDELMMVVRQAIENAPRVNEPKADPVYKTEYVKGTGELAMQLYELVELVAPTNMSVIIEGESGTGKEYVARLIHASSKRASRPFIPIDCGVLSNELAATELFGYVRGAFTGAVTDKRGQFESASGGTMFLDEIGNLSIDVQVKLLRALQEKIVQPVGSDKLINVDIRFIVATSAGLHSGVEKGDFREDLFHRLNEFKIQVPPIRDRGDDLFLFTDFFIREANLELSRNVESLAPEVYEIFSRYDWPGNLRELRNTIRRMVLLTKGKQAGKDLLPPEMVQYLRKDSQPTSGTNLKTIQANSEKEQIERVLEETKGNKSKAARKLNIDRKTLYNKMEKYGLH